MTRTEKYLKNSNPVRTRGKYFFCSVREMKLFALSVRKMKSGLVSVRNFTKNACPFGIRVKKKLSVRKIRISLWNAIEQTLVLPRTGVTANACQAYRARCATRTEQTLAANRFSSLSSRAATERSVLASAKRRQTKHAGDPHLQRHRANAGVAPHGRDGQ